jgi:hypothetical protein
MCHLFGYVLSQGLTFLLLHPSSFHCDCNNTVNSNTVVLKTSFFKLATRTPLLENMPLPPTVVTGTRAVSHG